MVDGSQISQGFWSGFDELVKALKVASNADVDPDAMAAELLSKFVLDLISISCPKVAIDGLLFCMVLCNVRFQPTLEVLYESGHLLYADELLNYAVLCGSTDANVHTCLAAIQIQNGMGFQVRYCNLIKVGRYLEMKGEIQKAKDLYQGYFCDDQYIEVTSKTSSFQELAVYAFRRRNVPLWNKLLRMSNIWRGELLDEVVSMLDGVGIHLDDLHPAAIAFTSTRNSVDTYRFMEKVFYGRSPLKIYPVYNNALLLAAIIKGGHDDEEIKKILKWVDDLGKSYDGNAVGKAAANKHLYDVAVKVFRKFDMNEEAVSVMMKAGKIDEASLYLSLYAKR